MKPNIAGEPARRGGRAGARDDRAPRQRARRDRAEHRAAGHHGDQILVQLPGVTDVERAKEHHPVDRAARAEDRRAGAVADEGGAAASTARCRTGMEIVPGATGAPGDAGTVVLPGARRRRRSPAATCATRAPSLDENNQPAVSFTLSNDGGAQVRQGHRREHRPPAGDRARRPRAVGAAHRGADHDRRPHHRQLHAGGSAEPVADPPVGRAAGVADLPRGADDRPDASAPTRSARASSPRSSACCSSSCSCWSTTGCRA